MSRGSDDVDAPGSTSDPRLTLVQPSSSATEDDSVVPPGEEDVCCCSAEDRTAEALGVGVELFGAVPLPFRFPFFVAAGGDDD